MSALSPSIAGRRLTIVFLVLTMTMLLARWQQITPGNAANTAPNLPHPFNDLYDNQHPWSHEAHDPLGSAQAAVIGPQSNPVQPAPWPFDAEGTLSYPPVIASNGVAFVGEEQGIVRALRPGGPPSAIISWTFDLEDNLAASLALKEIYAQVDGGSSPLRAYAVSTGGRVVGLDGGTGSQVWSYSLGSPVPAGASPIVTTEPAAGLAELYLATGGGVTKLNEQGSPEWPGVTLGWQQPAISPHTRPALSPDGASLYAVENNLLHVLDTANGNLTCSLDLSGQLTAPVVTANGSVLLGSTDGVLFRVVIDPANCNSSTADDLALSEAVTEPPALAGGGLVAVAAGPYLHGIDLNTWTILWTTGALFKDGVAPVADAAGTTFMPLLDGRYRGTGVDGSPVWTSTLPEPQSQFADAAVDGSGRLYVGNGLRLHVLMDEPAYLVLHASEASQPGNRDIHGQYVGYNSLGALWRATLAGSAEDEPAMRLDGRQMAFVNVDGDATLMLGNGAGRDAVPLLLGDPATEPAFSPVQRDGSSRLPRGGHWLAASVTTDADGPEILLIDLETHATSGVVQAQQLWQWFFDRSGDAVEQRAHHFQPAFSPDGRYLAYTACTVGGGEQFVELVLVDLVQTPPQRHVLESDYQVGIDCGAIPGYHPAFVAGSPYLLAQWANGDLARYDLNGVDTVLHNRSTTEMVAAHPAGSPDGIRLAFFGLDTRFNQDGIFEYDEQQGRNSVYAGDNADYPAYHPLRLPEPWTGTRGCLDSLPGTRLSDDGRQTPGELLTIFGCGFDLIHPSQNQVYFQRIGGGIVAADVVSATWESQSERAALVVRVPQLAGDGPVTVHTPAGEADGGDFTVKPLPLHLEPDSGAAADIVRIVGYGLQQADDPSLATPLANRIYFTGPGGSQTEEAEIMAAGVGVCGITALPCPTGSSGVVQWLDVQVPEDAMTGTVAVANTAGDRATCCSFSRYYREANLALSLDELPTCGIYENGQGRFEFFLLNTGPDAALLPTLTMTLTHHADFTATTGPEATCQVNGRYVNCSQPWLQPYEWMTATLMMTPTQDTLMQAVAHASSSSRTNYEPSWLSTFTDTVPFDLRFLPAPTQTIDLDITDIEVTQGIQDLANSVPLVAAKRTMVRVYVDTGGANISGVPARLFRLNSYGLPDGPPLSPQRSCNTLLGAGPNRDVLTNTINFELPDSWLEGDYSLRAVVNHERTLAESDFTNNEQDVATSYVEMAPLCLRTYRVRGGNSVSDNVLPALGALTGTPQNNLFIDRALSMLPVSEIRVFAESGVVEEWEWDPLPGYGPYELGRNDNDDGWAVLHSLWWRNFFSDDPDWCDDRGALSHYTGMVNPNVEDSDYGGKAYTPGDEMFANLEGATSSPFTSPWGGKTIAHEAGHNYGREHVDCVDSGDGPANPDDNYPYEPCSIGPDQPTAFYGLDLSVQGGMDIITPTEAGDLMSYRSARWPSDYTWNAIAHELCDDSGCNWPGAWEPAPATARPVASSAGPYWIAAGSITAGSASFEHLYHVETELVPAAKLEELLSSPLLRANAAGNYLLTASEEGGTIIASQAFTVAHATDGGASAAFHLLLPYTPQAVVVQLYDPSDNLLAEIPVSENPPTVGALQATWPNTTTLHLSWVGADGDGDPLHAIVQYSYDGGLHWQTVATDVPTDTVALDATTLPGSDSNSRFRVIVSDGAHGAWATSSPFSAPWRAPLVTATATVQKAAYDSGQDVILSGSAFDAEDGYVTFDTLQWSLDSPTATNRIVGNGEEIRLSLLPPGAYTATLTATDSHGLHGAATASFTIRRCVRPAPPPLVMARSGNDVLLQWQLDPDYHTGFAVYRSGEPYFYPALTRRLAVLGQDNEQYRDLDALPGTNFYLLESEGCGASSRAFSGRGGSFSFNLEPGQ